MKKIILNLFVMTALVLSVTSCSSDDDGGNGGAELLTMIIDGQTLSFDQIIVDEDTYTENGVEYTEIDVTATIGGDTTRVVEFSMDSGDTGADAVYYFMYREDGVEYYNNFGTSDFSIVVSSNNGSNISATFSGELTGYNNGIQVSVSITNGSVSVDY